jgi:hypothetical protein
MFYGQCWECGERWALGTASTCTCVEEPKREWVGLTDEEIYASIKNVDSLRAIEVARAIEAKLKEKNNG